MVKLVRDVGLECSIIRQPGKLIDRRATIQDVSQTTNPGRIINRRITDIGVRGRKRRPKTQHLLTISCMAIP